MVKIGPAFFDSVKDERLGRARSRDGLVPSGTNALAPVFFLVLIFAIILVRLFYLQVLRGNYYKNLSDQNRTRTEVVAAPRGIILDRNARPLVANSASYRFLARDEALRLISQGKKVESDVERDYLTKATLTHALGYTGKISESEITRPEFDGYSSSDFVGKTGIERTYEKVLHGTNGKRLFEVDARGKKIRELGISAPIPGENIHTTLDRDVALSVGRAMENVARGAVVVSNPRDGGIYALYSAPSFDPNIFTHSDIYKSEGNYTSVESVLTDTENRPLLNRAISGVYPPASTFKLVAATAALQKGSVKKSTRIEDTGILTVGEFSFGNWYFLQYGRTEGSLDIVGAISRSNDIFFYKTAEATGVDYISGWAREFGLGARLGIDIPGESAGTVPTVEWKESQIGEQWYLGDTYSYGIGQGYLLTTPLQVNSFTQVFANGGTLFQPHLLLGKNKILKKDFIKSANLDLVREGMAQSCDVGGVAWPFFQFKVRNSKLKVDNKDYFRSASDSAEMIRIKVACKTGTAEVGGKDDKPHSWITVFAPFYKPEIVVTVLVENGGEGSSIAGPIARDILRDYFERKTN